MLSGCASNPELLAEAKPFYQGQKVIINKNCSSCSYMSATEDKIYRHSVSWQDEDSYTITDIGYASVWTWNKITDYVGYYLTAENDREVQQRKDALKKGNVKKNTLEQQFLELDFPIYEYRFPISQSQLKNHEFPKILDKDGYKEKVEDDRKKALKKQAEEKRRLAEKNREISRIKNSLHSQGCNQYWDYVYGGKPFIDYLVNLKIDKDNQVYCKKNVYGMDIFVWVKSPHKERKGIGLIADSSDKTLYRKSWEESGEVYECNKILCEDPLNGISVLDSLLLFGLM